MKKQTKNIKEIKVENTKYNNILDLSRTCELLIEINTNEEENKKQSVYQMCSNINLTYSYAFQCILKLKQKGYINMEKHGRTNHITLTLKGIQLCNVIKQYINVTQ